MSFRIHNVLARDITVATGGAGGLGIRQSFVCFNPPVTYGVRRDCPSRSGIAVIMIKAVYGAVVRKLGLQDGGKGNHLAQRATETLDHIVLQGLECRFHDFLRTSLFFCISSKTANASVLEIAICLPCVNRMEIARNDPVFIVTQSCGGTKIRMDGPRYMTVTLYDAVVKAQGRQIFSAD
jgi:hypothetical protein